MFAATEAVRVYVFDAATEKPLADAEVWYLHEEDQRQARLVFPAEWHGLRADLGQRLARFGRSSLTGPAASPTSRARGSSATS